MVPVLFVSATNHNPLVLPQRPGRLWAKERACWGIFEDLVDLVDLVEGEHDRIFEPSYLLSQLQAIKILPCEAQQPLHLED